MPHAGLIPSGLSKGEELLLRAKLHIRGGRIRQQKGDTADAIAAFYDALVSAFERFFVSQKLRSSLNLPAPQDISDEKELMHILRQHGVISSQFGTEDLEEFASMLENAFEGNVKSPIDDQFMEKYEGIMNELEVLPIGRNELPDELAPTT